jgi:hypothetical protein
MPSDSLARHDIDVREILNGSQWLTIFHPHPLSPPTILKCCNGDVLWSENSESVTTGDSVTPVKYWDIFENATFLKRCNAVLKRI